MAPRDRVLSGPRWVDRLLNPVLRRADLALVPRAGVDGLTTPSATPLPPPPLPSGAEDVLRRDHPTLVAYERRYEGHPGAASSQWSADYVGNTIDLRSFRANNSYVWQEWDRADSFRYGLTAYYTRLRDRLGLFERLEEDGLFGAETFDIDGMLVSRDLLDSIAELTFLDEHVGLSRRELTILDIGAGYGRLAHRATTAFENVRYVCTDGVPLSTFLSGFYLDFRGLADRATVVPLDRIEDAIADVRIDVAVNIHSWAECPVDTIRWWLELLRASTVEHLMIVPNTKDRLLSKERNAPRLDFLPLVRSAGFELVRKRPKYGESEFMQVHGLHGRFPMFYFLFRRRR